MPAAAAAAAAEDAEKKAKTELASVFSSTRQIDDADFWQEEDTKAKEKAKAKEVASSSAADKKASGKKGAKRDQDDSAKAAHGFGSMWDSAESPEILIPSTVEPAIAETTTKQIVDTLKEEKASKTQKKKVKKANIKSVDFLLPDPEEIPADPPSQSPTKAKSPAFDAYSSKNEHVETSAKFEFKNEPASATMDTTKPNVGLDTFHWDTNKQDHDWSGDYHGSAGDHDQQHSEHGLWGSTGVDAGATSSYQADIYGDTHDNSNYQTVAIDSWENKKDFDHTDHHSPSHSLNFGTGDSLSTAFGLSMDTPAPQIPQTSNAPTLGDFGFGTGSTSLSFGFSSGGQHSDTISPTTDHISGLTTKSTAWGKKQDDSASTAKPLTGWGSTKSKFTSDLFSKMDFADTATPITGLMGESQEPPLSAVHTPLNEEPAPQPPATTVSTTKSTGKKKKTKILVTADTELGDAGTSTAELHAPPLSAGDVPSNAAPSTHTKDTEEQHETATKALTADPQSVAPHQPIAPVGELPAVTEDAAITADDLCALIGEAGDDDAGAGGESGDDENANQKKGNTGWWWWQKGC